MGVPVLLMGESGTGKSTSMRNFGKEEIAIINVMGKPLPFRGKYDVYKTRNLDAIRNAIRKTNRNAIVIDDFGYTLTDLYMRHSYGVEKYRDQYEVYKEIAAEVWQTINTVTDKLDDDKVVYFIMHTTVENGQIIPATIGKLLNEKINLVGMFTVTMISTTDGEDYSFIVGNNPPAKAPDGMFSEERIPNDLKAVNTAIRDYYEMDSEGGDVGE